MKTNPLITLLAVTGIALTLARPAAYAQEAVRSDTSGTLLTPLNLGSTKITGTLSPDHLGVGTPTSATVLRGDGTWVSTTPSGATVASTGNLLMGDSAGNAVGVASSANLERALRTRLEARQLVESAPANLLAVSNLASGAINADGTITIAANGSVQWSVIVAASDVANTPLYGYVVATADAPYGALRIRANYGVDHDSESTDSTLAPGVYRTQFLNLMGVYAYNIFVRNSTTGSSSSTPARTTPSSAEAACNAAFSTSRATWPMAPVRASSWPGTRAPARV